MLNHPFRNVVSYVSVGLLAASSFAFGQDPMPPQSNTSTNQQQAANPSGGWKRVGDSQNADPNAVPGYPMYSADQAQQMNGVPQSSDSQNPPPPPPPAGPQQNAPVYGQQPMNGQPPYQQQYPQSYPPVGYSQQPMNGQPGYYPSQQQPGYYPQQQPGYGQQPYPAGPQQNYPAPPPVPASLTIPQGTFITVRINQFLSSDKNNVGDAFSATLVDPIVVNGVVVAEPGETVGGRVALVEKHGVGHPAKLGVQITNLTLVDGQQVTVNTQLTSRRGGTTPGGIEAGTIIGTTGLGAAIGAAAGWGTGAAIGAGAGALAGIIGTVVTHNHASVITPEQVLTFQIQAPVTFSTTASQQAFHYVEPGEYSQQPPYGGGPGPGAYVGAGPAPAPYAYGYAYPYPYYAYGYPYYWGPSFAFWYGPGFYRGGFYGRGYVGGFRGGVAVRAGGGVAVRSGGGVRR
jgi:hypothetical protein